MSRRSGNLIVAVMLLGFVVGCAGARQLADQRIVAGPNAQFSNLLIELETSVLYSYQVDRWRDRRPSWLNEVRSASGLADYKRLLLEFESDILSSGQNQNWLRESRMGWINGVRNANSIRDLSRSMKECEANILWIAQTTTWKQNRQNWVNKVNRLESGW